MKKQQYIERLWIPLEQRMPPIDDPDLRIVCWDPKHEEPFTIRAVVLVRQHEMIDASEKRDSHPGFRATHWMNVYSPRKRI